MSSKPWCMFVVICVVGAVFLAGCNEQKTPTPPKGVTIKEKAVQVVERMNNRTLDAVFSSWFSPVMKNATSASQLEAVWVQLQNQSGVFSNITHTRNTTTGNYTNVYVTCVFGQQNSVDCELTFDAQGLVAGLHFVPSDLTDEYRSPSYANESAFTEMNVTVGNGTAWPLPGTLTMPKGTGPFPAVVLVQGSGPNDRNETILANEPFKDLAWGLASQGIAVLRYEKRTKQYGTKIANNQSLFSNFTVYDETVQDAQRAVTLLQQTPGVNASKIYVLGHSLGAMLAPRIAANKSGIAGLVLMAAPARPLEDLMLNQVKYLADLDHNISSYEAQTIRNYTTENRKIHFLAIGPTEIVLGAGRAYWADLNAYNPINTAENLTLPMLILQGKRDYQVNYTHDFLPWQNAFKNRQNVTFIAYDNLSHLFMPASVPPSPADYAVPGNIPLKVITDIATWIKAQ